MRHQGSDPFMIWLCGQGLDQDGTSFSSGRLLEHMEKKTFFKTECKPGTTLGGLGKGQYLLGLGREDSGWRTTIIILPEITEASLCEWICESDQLKVLSQPWRRQRFKAYLWHSDEVPIRPKQLSMSTSSHAKHFCKENEKCRHLKTPNRLPHIPAFPK